MIQDITPHNFSVVYTPIPPVSDSPVIVLRGGKLYAHEDASFITFGELSSHLKSEDLRFLFTIDEKPCFMLRDDHLLFGDTQDSEMILPLKNIRIYDWQQVRSLEDISHVFTVYTASHLIDWYHANRFCGCCGSPMTDGVDERKVVCTSCKKPVYPRINPAVIVAVTHRDHLLMTRYAGRSVNWLVLVAGFNEIGESAEDTVRREVLEETGVRVKNIRYFGSQPWGTPGNLTLGYTAELDGPDTLSIDAEELSEACWVHRDDIPARREYLSITQEMIQAFKDGKF